MIKRIFLILLCISILAMAGCSTGSRAPIAKDDYMPNIELFGNKEGGENYAVGSAKTAQDDAAAMAEQEKPADKEHPKEKETGFLGGGNPFAKGGV